MKAIWIGLGASLALWAGAAQAATPCAGLTATVLPHATVTSAVDVAAGPAMLCKIDVTAKPTADSDIRIEVWIPEGAAWNGRFVQFGNGGFAGQIRSQQLSAVAAAGYATAATDDGHQTTDGTDGRWAIGHPQKVIDFGWRALKETTNAAEALIQAYEGAAPKYAYFDGCSDGGREALMEAQRFPNDFDGIVAGAPAYNFSGLLTLAAHDMQALAKPGGYLDANALKTLEAGALAACGGGVYVADEASCRFDPAGLACPPGQPGATCLTPGELATARAIYDGITSYHGHSPGAEAERGSWVNWTTGPSADQTQQALSFKFATGFWGGFVYGDPNYDVLKLDIAHAARASAAVAKEVNATDPNLAPFRAHGGKLIQYHGWNDPAIPSTGSIVYYENVQRTLGDVSSFYRLYLIPGMLHCGGGASPTSADWLGAIRAWVEQGQAPDALVLKSAPNAPPAQQVVCPYPAVGGPVGTADTRCITVTIEAPPPPPRPG